MAGQTKNQTTVRPGAGSAALYTAMLAASREKCDCTACKILRDIGDDLLTAYGRSSETWQKTSKPPPSKR